MRVIIATSLAALIFVMMSCTTNTNRKHSEVTYFNYGDLGKLPYTIIKGKVSSLDRENLTEDSVSALKGALIYVMTKDHYMQEKVWTDTTGHFNLSLPKGYFDIFICCDNYQQVSARRYYADTNRISIMNVMLVKGDRDHYEDSTISNATINYRFHKKY